MNATEPATHSALPTILSLARQALEESPYHALRYVSCQVQSKALVLRGRLETYYMKQRAQEAVMAVTGPFPVINQIEVTGWHRTNALS